MKKVISLIACVSIAVFAQNGGYPPPQPVAPPPQQQVQYPPPPPAQAPAPQPQYQQAPQYQPAPQQQYQQAPQYQQYPQQQYQQAPQQQYQQYPQQQAQPYPQQPYMQPMPVEPQKEEMNKRVQFGISAQLNLNDVTTEDDDDVDDDYEIGLGVGFGAGMVVRIPITNIISIVPGVNFFYRTLRTESYEGEDYDYYSGSYIDYSVEMSLSEFALSIPVMAQVSIPRSPVYFSAGLQLDIPFSSKIKYEEEYDGDKDSESSKLKKRQSDLGLGIGVGFNIGEHIALECRSVFGTRSITSNNSDDSQFNQYAFVFNSFF